MATEIEDIRRWLERGKAEGATHLIVVCDTFDWDDYPVFVSSTENVREKEKDFNQRSMQKVMEVYNISMDWYEQLYQYRSFNY